MKALTVHQPWAWAIAHGHKTVENRPWTTSYRGPLAVHAGRRHDPRAVAVFERAGVAMPDDMPRGVIVAVVDLVDVVDDHPSPWSFVEHRHWLLANVRRLDRPVPARGRLGLWALDDATITAVFEALAT